MPGKDQEQLRKQAEQRKAVIELMHQHLKQVQLEAAKTGKEIDDDVSSLEGGDFQDGESIQLMQMDLKALDHPDFEKIRQNEEDIDAGLGRVHEGVKRLKMLAMQAGDVLEEQEEQIQRLNELAGEANEDLKSANHILSKVIKDVKSPGMFCCDCILCLMVIGIVIGLYFALTN